MRPVIASSESIAPRGPVMIQRRTPRPTASRATTVVIAAVDDRPDRLGAAPPVRAADLERVGHRLGSLGTTKPDDAVHRLLYDAGMATVLHDPATYTTGFPYERFAELRDHDPVSHHEHPGLDARLLGDLATPTCSGCRTTGPPFATLPTRSCPRARSSATTERRCCSSASTLLSTRSCASSSAAASHRAASTTSRRT